MRRTALIAGSTAAVLAPISTMAAEAIALTPRTPWRLASTADRCSLVREFGDEGALRLQIDSFGSRQNFRFQVSGSLVPKKDNDTINLSLSYDSQPRDDIPVMQGTLNNQPAIFWNGGFFPVWSAVDQDLVEPGEKTAEQKQRIDQILNESVGKVEHITVGFPGRDPLRLQTDNMAEPIARIRGCVDKLITGWGLDPATYWSQSRVPQPSSDVVGMVTAFVRLADFGKGPAFVPVRVSVDARGQATDCVVQALVATENVRKAFCRALMGTYEPALDANGNPVASVYQSTIVWMGSGSR